MDIANPNQGWIIQTTDVLSDPGTRGLYNFDPSTGGVSFIADPFGADISSGGDLTLDSTGSFLWATTGDDLWRIDFDGTGTLLGTIQIDGEDAGTIPGLTIDPSTGGLIGYTTGEELIRIDPNTLSANVVGTFDTLVGGVGALDVTLDGRVVGSLSLGGDLFEIDTQTAGTTSLGSTGENVSALAFEIPTPGAMGLLAVAGLAATRRRR
jgi:hypothetical protein